MLLLVGLNEISFDIVIKYVEDGKLPGFRRLLDQESVCKTISESEYHLLEPWIQWVTVHTGKSYSEHQIFRLGDIERRPEVSQLYERLESSGVSVGAVSPFNASNRLQQPLFFVSDPWTRTVNSGSWFVRKLADAVSDAVNNNAGERMKLSTMAALLVALVAVPSPRRWIKYVKAILNRRQPGVKAKVLDMLLADLFMKLVRKHQPGFAELFLNAGAHIQHHYLRNSKVVDCSVSNPDWYCPNDVDPLLDILEEYDDLLIRLYSEYEGRFVIATGLSQVLHDRNTYYYRLKEPASFLHRLGCESDFQVETRMSRDFLVNFDNEEACRVAEYTLGGWMFERGQPVFSIDNRGKSLFLEFIVDVPIEESIPLNSALMNSEVVLESQDVDFVAIKNGEHSSEGTIVFPKREKYRKQISLESVYDELLGLAMEGT